MSDGSNKVGDRGNQPRALGRGDWSLAGGR